MEYRVMSEKAKFAQNCARKLDGHFTANSQMSQFYK